VGGLFKRIEIAGKASKIPTEMYNYINKPTILMSLTTAQNIFGDVNKKYMTAETMFKSNDLQRTVSDMETLCQNSKNLKEEKLSNVKESRETLGNLVSIVQLIMYIFTFMLSMISLMNVFNTISADMDKRRREYATSTVKKKNL
jgi:ABC-type antimicrobial peptide transport system permease subunit